MIKDSLFSGENIAVRHIYVVLLITIIWAPFHAGYLNPVVEGVVGDILFITIVTLICSLSIHSSYTNHGIVSAMLIIFVPIFVGYMLFWFNQPMTSAASDNPIRYLIQSLGISILAGVILYLFGSILRKFTSRSQSPFSDER